MLGKTKNGGRAKYRRPGFSRRALKAYLTSGKGATKDHKCGDPRRCVVANFIADEVGQFPKGTDTVRVYGDRIAFEDESGLVHVNYDAPRWVYNVVDRFDRSRQTMHKTYLTGAETAKVLDGVI